MKKILLSLATAALVGAAVIGGTAAIFSDTEVSTGNTFTAGAIDLTVDNESYYNGVFNQGTSWLQKDLEEGDWFFNFRDLKPGDWGEDTISLHVNNNDSWLCADVTLTSNQDNGNTEPEFNDEQPWTAGEGELADNVHFIWWADDGDNVLEEDEELLPGGPLGALGVGETATVPLADSNMNIWNENQAGGPLPGDDVRYIGKAWCFGNLNMQDSTYPQDNYGYGENNDNGPIQRPVVCDGSQEDNSTQTDSMTADVSFRAVQSRNNTGFVCQPETQPETATLTVDKIVGFSSITLSVGVGDFTLHVSGPNGYEADFTDEIAVAGLEPGTYTVSETYTGSQPLAPFDPAFGLNCLDGGSTGTVTLAAGDNLTCQITNIVAPAL